MTALKATDAPAALPDPINAFRTVDAVTLITPAAEFASGAGRCADHASDVRRKCRTDPAEPHAEQLTHDAAGHLAAAVEGARVMTVRREFSTLIAGALHASMARGDKKMAAIAKPHRRERT